MSVIRDTFDTVRDVGRVEEQTRSEIIGWIKGFGDPAQSVQLVDGTAARWPTRSLGMQVVSVGSDKSAHADKPVDLSIVTVTERG